MKRLLFFSLTLLPPCAMIQAQTTLSGTIRDSTGKPLPFASVALLNARDSSVAKGMASDQQGVYAFENVRAGRYVVRATAVHPSERPNAAELAYFGGQNPNVPTDDKPDSTNVRLVLALLDNLKNGQFEAAHKQVAGGFRANGPGLTDDCSIEQMTVHTLHSEIRQLTRNSIPLILSFFRTPRWRSMFEVICYL